MIACRSRLERHTAHALYTADLTASVTNRTSLNAAAAIRRTRALTIGTTAHTVVGNILFDAENSLLKGDADRCTDIISRYGTVTTTCRASSKRTAEHSSENVTEIAKISKSAEAAAKITKACTAAHRGIERRMTELIVFCLFIGIRKHLVCLVGFLKLFLCYLIAGIGVGMILLCQLVICLFDRSRICVLSTPKTS